MKLYGTQYVYGPEPWEEHPPVLFADYQPLILGPECNAEEPCVYYVSPQTGIP